MDKRILPTDVFPPTEAGHRQFLRAAGKVAIAWLWIEDKGVVKVRFNGVTYVRRPKVPKRCKYFEATVKEGGVRLHRSLHRDIYAFFFGPIPDAMDIDHLNDNPLDLSRDHAIDGKMS